MAFWSITASDVLRSLQSTPQGLSSDEAERRLTLYGYNLLKPKKRSDPVTLLVAQFRSPIIIILIFAALLSLFLGESASAFIILAIVFVSGLLGFWQERGAANIVEKLLAMIQIKATILRDASPSEIPVEEAVPGDVVMLNAGDIVPGDCLILESRDLFVNEAALTGETYPVEKLVNILPREIPLSQRTNSLFMGTNVVSGRAKALVVHTGRETEFGKVSERLSLRPPETEFERGIRRFGYLLMEVTLVLVVAIFAINAYFGRPILESFLFSLALAVGLTPQLLPAIVSVNLAYGAKRMAVEKVVVKRLVSIENFGSMNVLCSDKTGTLTEGLVRVHSAIDLQGNESDETLLYAYLNSVYETGFTNPIDEAIRTRRQFDVSGYHKLDEVPYDFVRKRMSILVSKGAAHVMTTKGALPSVLEACSFARTASGNVLEIANVRDQILSRFEELSRKGFRLLGVAHRDVGSEIVITKSHESGMTFLGFLLLYDSPKRGIVKVVKSLRNLGISLRIVTGDNELVAGAVSQQVGLSNPQVISGPELRQMSDEALLRRVNDTDVFAEVDPNQKERIILAMKKAGNVVGFMGDGINDAPAIHAADVGISVDRAVDVAKNAADIVLLEKDLGVLVQGVEQGRKTFANTLKYVFMATSANFGNMFSMAGASLFLPFLPMLPKQILLTNLMTDFPEMAIATDSVDHEMVEKPRRWNISFIERFMVTFGLLSSLFDYITFGVLLFILAATIPEFRTGWFLESVVSASMIVLVIRSQRSLLTSTPSKYLSAATLMIAAVTLVLPFTPLGRLFGFGPLPVSFLLIMGIVVVLYVIAAEVVKRVFYRKVKF